MTHRASRTNASTDGAKVEVQTSGLTALKVSPDVPIIFGTAKIQALLLRIACEGEILVGNDVSVNLLFKSGLITIRRLRGGMRALALDPIFPAFDELRVLLADLNGIPTREGPFIGGKSHAIKYTLARINSLTLRVLFQVIVSHEALDSETLRRRLPDVWPISVTRCITNLVRDRLLVRGGDGGYVLAKNVPASLPALIVKTSEWLGQEDARINVRPAQTGRRPSAYMSAEDGAPRLFGTDVRLRNLMALAKHGRMLHRDLRKLTGAYHLHLENYDEAPFTRGGVVRVWETSAGEAMMIDPDYPLALPLLRLLRRLEETYPLPPHVSEFEVPAAPPRRPWSSDRLALFGSVIPTKILLSLGPFGWTFEALCTAVAIGKHRLNVKRALYRLEREGVLQASRPRGSGFNVRVMTISNDFPARDELMELIQAYLVKWPGLINTVERKMRGLGPRTIEHLKRRELWPYS